MLNVGVIGHTGRLGKPLVEILTRHSQVEIKYTQSRSTGTIGVLSDVELVFLALPYHESSEYLASLSGHKVIDLSIDHRVDAGWVYGLSEINREEIKTADKIANPGCYATAIIEALDPVKDKIRGIEIKAYSGVSGRPDQPVVVSKGIECYARQRSHAQVEEIETMLGRQISFFEANLAYPIKTGIVAIMKAELLGDVKSCYENLGSDFIRMVDYFGEGASVENLKQSLVGLEGSNFCNIAYLIDGNTITIVSALDNVIKGGSGQAVQNMNIMYGFNEAEGLIINS